MGIAIGSFMAGYLGNILGRKDTFYVGSVLVMIFSFISFLSTGPIFLAITRLMFGVIMG